MALKIDKEKCTGCGECVDTCPFEALELVDDKACVNESCTLCGSCVEACAFEAISIEDAPRRTDERTLASKGVWVFAEQRQGEMPEVVLELMGHGKRLADELGVELGAVVLGDQVKGQAEELFALGADVVYVADDPCLADFNDDAYCEVLAKLIKKYQPEIFLAGATSIGRSLVPRVATAVETGLTADCTSLTIDSERRLLLQTRPAFGGNIMATIICPQARPQMATVRPRVMKKGERTPGQTGRLIELTLEGKEKTGTRVLEVVKALDEKVNLTGAEVVVVGGRGLGGPEGFDLVRELAEALNGVVGATRGAVDLEWIGHAHQVGQTGRTIAPKLYIGLGVSGAVQHLVGMQASDTIVAVNTDPNAPIFEVATYGIVGDLFKVVPAMLDRLRELRGGA
ncbi:electron transfer flavoprotein subunit alpha [Dethiosulfatarculus sandiegensis]|uniref:Electron transfer flavoprotein subunit alpha n=1 Tax=Dethiosulfatarculus sandiegensis TaxID=1429043 RepID=A0A0D2G910_9BACT|nr:electron transfer flavoprotein subunit alpha [Dethiosulfatarculus sandiegensis]KIX11377.1 electron transfer flavoprotein subunit alpha [Dethiosulfatarculus sandiegensis]